MKCRTKLLEKNKKSQKEAGGSFGPSFQIFLLYARKRFNVFSMAPNSTKYDKSNFVGKSKILAAYIKFSNSIGVNVVSFLFIIILNFSFFY
jgi:hypothetical protein